MARRMTLEGGEVKAVVELMSYSSGLKRNIVQCLDDFNIPLLLNHTVIDIKGKDRVEGVTIAAVNEKGIPESGTEEFIECDTLLLSVGLLPENELSRKADITLSNITGGPYVDESMETNIEGIFACGNVLHVHDLVDNVTLESYNAGKNAADYIKGKRVEGNRIEVIPEDGPRYTVPKYINPLNINKYIDLRFRVGSVYKDCFISIYFDDSREIHIKKRILTPGEMENIRLTEEMFCKYPKCKKIYVRVEEE